MAVEGARKNCGLSGPVDASEGNEIKNSQAGQDANIPTIA
jgi:hypothetical protein